MYSTSSRKIGLFIYRWVLLWHLQTAVEVPISHGAEEEKKDIWEIMEMVKPPVLEKRSWEWSWNCTQAWLTRMKG